MIILQFCVNYFQLVSNFVLLNIKVLNNTIPEYSGIPTLSMCLETIMNGRPMEGDYHKTRKLLKVRCTK
jgi:hypothetical protein